MKLISVEGAEDPTIDGAFIPVEANLEAPTEGEFSRSAIIDLSEYAGDYTVRLAWLYQGFYGDDWYIDDVRVEGLTAELEALYLGQDPSPVFPGETVHVDWRITNVSPESAANFTATLALPDGGCDGRRPRGAPASRPFAPRVTHTRHRRVRSRRGSQVRRLQDRLRRRRGDRLGGHRARRSVRRVRLRPAGAAGSLRCETAL